jgi:CRISPR-associated protein Cas5d
LEAQFRRRAEHGKCFYQPYFGCREFPAYFRLDGSGSDPAPVDWTQDLGFMLYDVFDLSRPGTSRDRPAISLFQARVESGVLTVPDYESPEVFKASAGVA